MTQRTLYILCLSFVVVLPLAAADKSRILTEIPSAIAGADPVVDV